MTLLIVPFLVEPLDPKTVLGVVNKAILSEWKSIGYMPADAVVVEVTESIYHCLRSTIVMPAYVGGGFSLDQYISMNHLPVPNSRLRFVISTGGNYDDLIR